MGLAGVSTAESQTACAATYDDPEGLKRALEDMAVLKTRVIDQLTANGQFDESAVRCECFLNLRYGCSDTSMIVPEPAIAIMPRRSASVCA